MIQEAAPMSMSIRIMTGLVLGWWRGFSSPPPSRGFSCFRVYCWRESAWVLSLCAGGYELSGDRLIVRFRRGEKEFGPVVGCSLVAAYPSWSLRLWGNGGLFAGTGIFWNRAWGSSGPTSPAPGLRIWCWWKPRPGKFLSAPGPRRNSLRGARASDTGCYENGAPAPSPARKPPRMALLQLLSSRAGRSVAEITLREKAAPGSGPTALLRYAREFIHQFVHGKNPVHQVAALAHGEKWASLCRYTRGR